MKENVHIIKELSENICEALAKIDYSNDPLIVIESRVNPEDYDNIVSSTLYKVCTLVFFPKFWDYDGKRMMGVFSKDGEKRALDFYFNSIGVDKIDVTHFPLELIKTAWRYRDE